MKNLILTCLIACSSPPSMEPTKPFQIPTWIVRPTDDEIIRAIVGPGASSEISAAAHDLFEDQFTDAKTVADVRWRIDNLKIGYDLARERDRNLAFLRFAVGEEISQLGGKASALAQQRLQDPSSAPTVAARAAPLAKRLAELETRYRPWLPVQLGTRTPPIGGVDFGEYRVVAIARNHLHVALTGDISVTSGAIYSELVRRGVQTKQLDVDRPY
jgi:hypothetical protein